MTREEFIRELQAILGSSVETIAGDQSLEDLRGWDSMARVMFLAMADESIGERVSAKQLESCKTIDDLIALFPGKIF